jgi:hypothetical protein
MRKELPIAVFAGGILGILVAFGVWRANLALKPKNENLEVLPAQENTTSENFDLVIAKPENLAVLSASPATFSGVTRSGNLVAVVGDKDDYFVETDGSGGWQEEIELVPALNSLVFYSFDPESGKGTFKNLSVVFSSAFAETKSVEERLENAANPATAYLGVVTDIAEDTIQIKDQGDEIHQVAINKEVTFINNTTKTPKEVAFKDLAIGDFIIAMGTRNGNGVLHAKRILISLAPTPNPNQAILAEVIKFSKTEFTVKTESGELEVETGKIKLPSIKIGNKLILVGTEKEGTFTIRSLHILPDKE